VKLEIRAVRLHVVTEIGDAGRILKFGAGLNVLRADNTSGKSTALQAIVYALGLEGMLSASHRIPLPHAMTDQIEIRGVSTPVVSSYVELEIANGSGKIISVARSVKDPKLDSRLVRVFDGGRLTSVSTQIFDSTDYFVRTSGAAQNQAGFHRYLADFLGLDLPKVTKLDGTEVPLYLETIFPYLYVEQKHGWSSLQARMPNYLGIRDVSKRSTEFVLGLDAINRVRLRQRLAGNVAELEANWQALGRTMIEIARSSNVTIQNQHGKVSNGLDETKSVPFASVNGEWVRLTEALAALDAQRLAITERGIRSSGMAAPQLEETLPQLQSSLQDVVAVASAVQEERAELEARLDQLDTRLDALKEDLQRHKDSRTLENYGAPHAHSLLADHVCPTCHQSVADGSDIAEHAMTIAENIVFIERQLATFRATRADTAKVVEAMTARIRSLINDSVDYRTRIRSIRDTLVDPSSTPSVADVRVQVQVEDRIKQLKTAVDELRKNRDALQEAAQAWASQKRQLDELTTETSKSDLAVLDAVQVSLRSQLAAYGFKSLRPDEVEIQTDTYRPTNEGFDLGFDLSASDMIRLIWSYLFAILQEGYKRGAHLGLLIFDEPRQQDTARSSYESLLIHAQQQGSVGAQIIFATSEESTSLRAMLGNSRFTLIDLPAGEKLLQPI
jgi:regulator of replication initiation timing